VFFSEHSVVAVALFFWRNVGHEDAETDPLIKWGSDAEWFSGKAGVIPSEKCPNNKHLFVVLTLFDMA